jgi:hypothetical protein
MRVLPVVQRVRQLDVMVPPAPARQLRAGRRLGGAPGAVGAADGSLLPTPTSVLEAAGAFPPSPPGAAAGEHVDFLVASSPGSQSCVGESTGRADETDA